MPYIPDKYERKILDRIVYNFFRLLRQTGRLNYFLFKLAKTICCSYEDYRNFIGELEAAKLEIYRRQIAPYEDSKKEMNGDVE